MIRVLQLAPTDADFETDRSIAQLVEGLGSAFIIERRTIGRGGVWRNGVTAVAGLRRERAAAGIDVVHAWGTAALTAACLAGAGRIVYSPEPEARRASVDWVRAAGAYRAIDVVCPTSTLRRVHVERGVAAERVNLVRPGVDFSRTRKRRDAALRARLGFGEGDYVLMPAGESSRNAGHRLALWGVSMLHVLDERYKLLTWGRGPEAPAIRRFAERLLTPGVVADAAELARDVAYEDLLTAADAVLVTAEGPVATLPIMTGMAAGLPQIATVTYTVAELLEDRHTAVMVPNPSPRAVAQRVMDLRGDASLQWKICDAARAEAYEFFSMTRFLEEYRTLYRRIAAGGTKSDEGAKNLANSATEGGSGALR